MIIFNITILLFFSFHFVWGDNCSSASSCSECLLLDESCYWCGGLASENSITGCLRFNNDKIAELLCPKQWAHSKETCSVYESKDNLNLIKSALVSNLNYKDKIPDLLTNYLNGYTSSSDNDYKSELENKGILNSVKLLKTSSNSGSDLKSLLHKLLLLKLLRKMKNKGDGLSEDEKNLLNRLSSKSELNSVFEALPTTTTTTTTSTTTVAKEESGKKKDELSELLKLLRYEAEKRLHSASAEQQLELEGALSQDRQRHNFDNELNSLNENKGDSDKNDVKTSSVPKVKSTLSRTEAISKPTNSTSIQVDKVLPSVMSKVTAQNRNEKVSVKYEEKIDEALGELPKSKIITRNFNESVRTKLITTARSLTEVFKPSSYEESYCKLFDDHDLCNSDHNCTWCNTLDTCIYRSKNSYKTCVKNVENMVDDEYGLDRCFKAKHCKECVEDDKCYWCDVSQRCHTYPFFGYVPNSCGGDWYVKQCDVQLAVIIVVLPLIIILLGMVTFYFCLKYCHYRQKVLRVPLFEKPGIFDYRKDKKVYFVNPEDESSDDELAKEKMRKKYRIPLEKEPLIDPNT